MNIRILHIIPYLGPTLTQVRRRTRCQQPPAAAAGVDARRFTKSGQSEPSTCACVSTGVTAGQLFQLASRLPRDRFDVHVCAFSCDEQTRTVFERSGTAVARLETGVRISPFVAWQLIRYVRRLGPDLVHSWSTAHRLAYFAAAAARTPALVVSHTGGERARFMAFGSYRISTPVTTHVVSTDCPESRQACAGGAAGGNVLVIPPGIESPTTEQLARKESSRHRLRSALQLSPTTRIIGTASEFSARSRLQDAIWAADLLKVVRDDTHLCVWGDGPHHWRLDRYRRQLEITDRVHFLNVSFPFDDWLQCLDCFWEIDGRERASHALLAAMAHAVPAIAVDTPVNRALLHNSEGASLIPLGDRARLARQTQLVLDDAQTAERMKLAGREFVSKNYPIDRAVGRFADLYHELIRAAGHGGPR